MNKKVLTIILTTFFSIILWVFVSFSGEYFASLKLPIKIIDLPEGYTTASLSNDEVSVNLKGLGWQLTQFSFGRDLEFFISANNQTGPQDVSVQNSFDINPWITSSVRVVSVSPERIDFNVEKVYSKKIKLLPDLNFNIVSGYGIVSDVKIQPDSIVAYGPKSILDSIDHLTTDSKLLEDVDSPVSENLGIKVIKGITYEENFSLVEFDVQKIVDKTFDLMTVESMNVPESQQLLLYPAKVRVIVRGGIGVLGKLTADQIKIFVDFGQALQGYRWIS